MPTESVTKEDVARVIYGEEDITLWAIMVEGSRRRRAKYARLPPDEVECAFEKADTILSLVSVPTQPVNQDQTS